MAVVICIGVGGFGYKAFARALPSTPTRLRWNRHWRDDMLYLNFEVKDGVLVHSASMYDQTMASIDLRKAWASPGTRSRTNRIGFAGG